MLPKKDQIMIENEANHKKLKIVNKCAFCESHQYFEAKNTYVIGIQFAT